jgi:hypothetical protein
MARGPLTFKQADVTRAVRAVKAAGVDVLRVEVDRNGKIIVVAGEASENPAPTGEANSWDRIL